MKWLNIDQHIAVIEDIKWLFTELGHEVESYSLSGHASILGKTQTKIPELWGDNWCGTVGDPERRKQFAGRYKEEIDKYDGFIVTYPPVFAQLYELTDKPIIIDIPIRFDYTLENDAEKQQQWCDWLRTRIDSGQIAVVANNKLDQQYTERYLKRPIPHIPSFCEYTGMFYPMVSKHWNRILNYGAKYPGEGGQHFIDPNLFPRKRDVFSGRYPYEMLPVFKAILHLPYNVSTMSVFEQYTACIPLVFPSKDFLLQQYNWNLMKFREYLWAHRAGEKYWNEEHLFMLDQVSFQSIYNRDPKSANVPDSLPDPNNYLSMETVKWWTDLADFYDTDWMPEIITFNSYPELSEIGKREQSFFRDVSEKMRADRNKRKEAIIQKWENVLVKIGGAK